MIKTDELIHGCMAKAHHDEMTFVLLARDIAAPATIRYWALERIKRGKNKSDDPQIIEAFACAKQMEEQRA